MTDSRYEAVHFVEGFSDGVLNGTADCGGAPHHFELRSAEPNAPEIYELTPLSSVVFDAVVEAWAIWRRWEQARTADANAVDAIILALPEERERQAELRGFVSNWLAAAKATAFLAEGDFEQVPTTSSPGAVQATLRVKWSKLDTRDA